MPDIGCHCCFLLFLVFKFSVIDFASMNDNVILTNDPSQSCNEVIDEYSGIHSEAGNIPLGPIGKAWNYFYL